MKKTVLFLYVMAGLAMAQETEKTDLSARRESVVILKQHLAMRENRLTEMTAEIRERGATTDKKIGELVDLVAGLKDSQSSKRRISELKAEAIGGLKRMLQVLKEERRQIVQKLSSDATVPSEALKKDLETLDALGEKRVAQIMELVKSMPGGEEVAKYETDSTTEKYDGTIYENSRISEEWRQNRRDRVESEKERREIHEALEKSITELDRRQEQLKAAIAGGKLTASEKEFHDQDLGQVNRMLEQRKAQLVEVTTPSVPAEVEASKGEAEDLKGLFDDARRDIADEFGKTVRLYRAAAAEREKIHKVKGNLVAREKWLQENDPDSKKE